MTRTQYKQRLRRGVVDIFPDGDPGFIGVMMKVAKMLDHDCDLGPFESAHRVAEALATVWDEAEK